MMKCKLTLYRECKIKTDKNFKVDELEYYLDNFCDKYELPEYYNFVKPMLHTELKIKIDVYPELYFGNEGGDNMYLKIDYYYQEGSAGAVTYEYSYYHFIENKEWGSDSTCKLTLLMDTINSLKDSIEITDKSMIHRMHKPRFKRFQNKIRRVIDMRSEGVNPLLYRKSKTQLYEGKKWYIVYKNRDYISSTDFNQVNPVDVLLYSDVVLRTSYYYKNIDNTFSGAFRIGFTTLFDAKAKVILGLWENNRNDIITDIMELKYDGLRGIDYWISIDAGTIILYASDGYERRNEIKTWHISSSSGVWIYANTDTIYYQSNAPTDYPTGWNTLMSLTNFINVIPPMSEVNRTDSRLIKIIELPYSPIGYTENNGVISFDDLVVTHPSGAGLILNTNNAFKNELSFTNNLSTALNYIPSTPAPAQSRNIMNESKLFHSDFYFLKLVYDSFSKVFNLENIDFSTYYANEPVNNYRVMMDFIVSKNVSSNFYFKMKGFTYNYPLDDYEDLLIVKRNNELPIYSSQYINYIKTGFNYDVKNKELQEHRSGMNLATTIVGSSLALAGAVASDNPLFIAGALTGMVSSISIAVTNAVTTAIQNDNAIQQKLNSLKEQSISVSSIDDIDLLDEYTDGNNAYMMEYQATPDVRKALYDLFFYCGYKCEYQGIPDETSRLYFNYVSADIDCYGVNIPAEILNDYKNRYKIGLTILHKVDEGGYYNYDFEQQKENWEVELI